MKKNIFLVIASLFFAISAFAQSVQNIQGSWNGTLNAGMLKLRIVFHIEQKDGTYTATMDSPDQKVKGLPATSVHFVNDTLTIKAVNMGMTYTAMLQEELLSGTFVQGSISIPLELKRGETTEVKRPQNPLAPYQYHSEDVKFENKKAGITLAGTLTYPKVGNNFSAVVLVTGSGPQNRNEELLGHSPFLVLSDYLTNNGIAVLRYDDRGVAESGGVYAKATLEDFAEDALAAVAYLKTRKEINTAKIGMIGHSEGGIIAFMLAAKEGNSNLAFIVSMAGSTVRGDTLMKAQRYAIGKALGTPEEAIDQNEKLIEKVNAIIANHSNEYITTNINALIEEVLADIPDKGEAVQKSIKQLFAQMQAPEILSILAYNPSDDLPKITCPVLALNGEKDLQVPADMNLYRVEALVKSDVTVKKYPNLNHLFQHCSTGLPMEYSDIEETISPEVLNDIVSWIKKF